MSYSTVFDHVKRQNRAVLRRVDVKYKYTVLQIEP